MENACLAEGGAKVVLPLGPACLEVTLGWVELRRAEAAVIAALAGEPAAAHLRLGRLWEKKKTVVRIRNL